MAEPLWYPSTAHAKPVLHADDGSTLKELEPGPFSSYDRLLVAQAKDERLRLLTCDSALLALELDEVEKA